MPVNNAQVLFKHYTRVAFNNLITKDSNAFYVVEDTDGHKSFYLGETLLALPLNGGDLDGPLSVDYIGLNNNLSYSPVILRALNDSSSLYRQYHMDTYEIWDSGNDGPGSGLHADLLDGQHASAFLGVGDKAADSELLDGYNSTSFIFHNEVLQNTNPFGGRKLYISAMDNAFHSADRRFIVSGTRHLVSYGGETYPKLNPDWVEEYTYSISGNDYTITDTVATPPNVVVYDGTTLKTEISDYTYNNSTGVITLSFTPSGTIHIFPDWDTPQYLDSPVAGTVSDVYDLFDGSYESSTLVSDGYYMKIRIMATESGHSKFPSYPYGDIFISYYYTGTPDKTEYRAYNYSYYNHGIGWKKKDFTDYIGTKDNAGYVAKVSDGSNYGRTIMEFIIYGHDTTSAYTTAPTEIEWSKSRPNLNNDGATVTKFGPQTLYDDFNWTSGTVKIEGSEVYHPGHKPTASELTDLVAVVGGVMLGDLRFDNVEDGIFFDTTGSNSSNWIHVTNDYWLTLYAGRGYTSRINLTNNDGITFEENGSEIVRFDHGGNVGIGTNTPTELLHLYGATPNIIIDNTEETESGVIFRDVQATTAQYAKILFNSNGVQPNNLLSFYVDSSTPAMTIKGDGKVGIRTTPVAFLDVLSEIRVTSASNSAHGLRLEARNEFLNDTSSPGIFTSAGGTSSYTAFSGTGGHLIIEGRKAARNIYVKTGDTTTPQHIFDYNGNVGLGRLDPGFKLDILGDIRLSDRILFGGTNSYPRLRRSGEDLFVDLNTSTSMLVFKDGGDIGIGYDNPTQKLDVNGNGRFNGLLYASSFYDLEDTSYYLNPASVGLSLNIAGDIQVANGKKLILYGSSNYIKYNLWETTTSAQVIKNTNSAGTIALQTNSIERMKISNTQIEASVPLIIEGSKQGTDSEVLSTTTETTLFSFSKLDYDSAKTVITASGLTDKQITELLVIHDGTTAYATEYGTIKTGSDLFTVDVDISGDNVRIKVTSATADTVSYKIKYDLL
jgi:hypothetical protein